MKKHWRGFSLLELVILIGIVVGLSAFFIPRSINQTTYARTIAMNAMTMSLKSTVLLAKTEHTLQGFQTTIKVDGQAVHVTNNGYPTGSQDGIGAAQKPVAGFTPTFGPTTVYNLTAVAVNNCNVSYEADSGIVRSTTSGC
jgi:type II secretory pathway pseudopilin PulG